MMNRVARASMMLVARADRVKKDEWRRFGPTGSVKRKHYSQLQRSGDVGAEESNTVSSIYWAPPSDSAL